MTLRLVALMCVVLLLSLAAVGLLMNFYQQRFMREVQATAADVGQATLRTLEWTVEGAHPEAAAGGAVPDGKPGPAGKIEVHKLSRVRHVITTSTEDDAFTVKEQLVYPTDGFPQVLPGEALEDEFQSCLTARLEGQSAKALAFMINVEAVSAEPNPAGGLFLTLPRKMRSP